MRRDVAGSPRGESVERAARQEEVGDEGTEADRGGEVFRAPGGGRQVAREELLELEAVEEAADDGGGADFQGFEGGLVEGGSHRCLSAWGVRRVGCYGGRPTTVKEERGVKNPG